MPLMRAKIKISSVTKYGDVETIKGHPVCGKDFTPITDDELPLD